MKKYRVRVIIDGVIERDDTEQCVEQRLWRHQFDPTEIVNPQILDVEEVDLIKEGGNSSW